jgi:hypothetical protein
MGTPNVVRALKTMGAFARAQRDRFAMDPGGVTFRPLPSDDEHHDDEHHG